MNTTIETTIAALGQNGIKAQHVETGAEALALVKGMIPKGASIMNGSSRTLEQIGFVEYLKTGEHEWNNLHEAIILEHDKEVQSQLRKQASLSDYYLGSVHALTEGGVSVIASNTGSQLPHIVFTSPNIIFVVSTKKIVPTLEDGMTRLYEHVVPLEEAESQRKWSVGTYPNKIVIFNKENPAMGRNVVMILVSEDLGF